jgi:predicted O-methyltransferase YrrM
MTDQLPWRDIDLDGHPIASSIQPNEKIILRALARGRSVLEIGSGNGYSTIVMAQVARHVTAVDPHQGELPDSWRHINANLVFHNVADKVTLVREYSQDALPRLYDEGLRYGFIFVDGNHDVQVHSDVHTSLKLLASGGLIAVHDYKRGFPDVERVLDASPIEPVMVVDTLWVGR